MRGAALRPRARRAHQADDARSLGLAGNELGDDFVTSFVALLDEGGLAGVEWLRLYRNAISEQGMQELAAAIARGGLPSCMAIALDRNPGSAAPVEEAAKQRGGMVVRHDHSYM